MEQFNRPECKPLAIGLMLAGGMLALSGCTNSGGAPKAGFPVCHAVKADLWTRVPGNANLRNIATALGVSQAQAAAGKFGGAICEVAISADIVKNPAVVTIDGVAGIRSSCLVIGFQSGNTVPDATKSYTDILAICPAATIPVSSA